VSNDQLQAKMNQKLKLLQDKKKLIQNLKNLDRVEKEVQQEIDRITPEKRKFEEWAKYFGEDAKKRQVLKWFNDELEKLRVKAERVGSMRDKILLVQEKIDFQLGRINSELESSPDEARRTPKLINQKRKTISFRKNIYTPTPTFSNMNPESSLEKPEDVKESKPKQLTEFESQRIGFRETSKPIDKTASNELETSERDEAPVTREGRPLNPSEEQAADLPNELPRTTTDESAEFDFFPSTAVPGEVEATENKKPLNKPNSDSILKEPAAVNPQTEPAPKRKSKSKVVTDFKPVANIEANLKQKQKVRAGSKSVPDLESKLKSKPKVKSKPKRTPNLESTLRPKSKSKQNLESQAKPIHNLESELNPENESFFESMDQIDSKSKSEFKPKRSIDQLVEKDEIKSDHILTPPSSPAAKSQPEPEPEIPAANPAPPELEAETLFNFPLKKKIKPTSGSVKPSKVEDNPSPKRVKPKPEEKPKSKSIPVASPELTATTKKRSQKPKISPQIASENSKKNMFHRTKNVRTDSVPNEKQPSIEAAETSLSDKTEFDEFLSFEENFKKRPPVVRKETEETVKINYVKNQPIRPVKAEITPKKTSSKQKTVSEMKKSPPKSPAVAKKRSPNVKQTAPSEVKQTAPSEVKQTRPTAKKVSQKAASPEVKAQPTNEVRKRINVPKSAKSDVLYLGIDLGTYETTVAASNGEMATTISAVGWAKDLVSRKMLKKDIIFGAEALKHKLALRFFRPLENGVIKDTDEDQQAARELIKHVLTLIHPQNYKKVYAVIGTPAQANLVNEQAIIDAAREIIDAVTIVSEPFSVAYGEANIYNTLVIDIGAGTTDICRLSGIMPTSDDQISLLKAGDFIDNELIKSIKSRVRGAQITKDMARRWKETHSFVKTCDKPAIIEITVAGKPLKINVSSSIQKSCEAIVDDMVAAVSHLISTFDPESQDALKQNILLAGGGSLIRHLDEYLTDQLSSMGTIRVKNVPNPIEAGAKGALALAMDLTDDYWTGLL